MFESKSAHTRTGKFPLVSVWGRAEGLACADPGARTPIGASEILTKSRLSSIKKKFQFEIKKEYDLGKKVGEWGRGSLRSSMCQVCAVCATGTLGF